MSKPDATDGGSDRRQTRQAERLAGDAAHNLVGAAIGALLDDPAHVAMMATLPGVTTAHVAMKATLPGAGVMQALPDATEPLIFEAVKGSHMFSLVSYRAIQSLLTV